jgi:hypothetical protein
MLPELFELSGFGFTEKRREPNPERHHLCAGRDLFRGRCGLHGRGQAGLKLDRQTFGAEEVAGLDQVAATLFLAALFSVPVIILEPVKPVAAYLAATGRFLSSVVTLITGELLKLVRPRRMSPR